MSKKYTTWVRIINYLILWMIGGSVYYMIEILYRGFSHPSMFVVGGLCFLIIGAINEVFTWRLYLEVQLLVGDLSVLIVEFISGVIINIWLGWNVWDYSDLPYNLLGQICLPFAIMWIPIVFVAIIIDDWIKWTFLGGEAPRYYIWLLGRKNDYDMLIVPFAAKTARVKRS